MAHIEDRRKQGRGWRVRYRDPRGRERSKSFKLKIDADRFAVFIESAKMRGEWVDPRLGKVTLGEWSRRWFGTTAGLKPKSRAGYDSLLRTLILPELGDAPLGRIQPVDVHEWVAELTNRGLSASRIRQAYYVLSSMLRSAVESGYIARSPCIGVKLPKMTPREMHFLSAEEVRALAEEMPPPYDVLVYVLAYGGLRWGEAAALRRSRCDLLRSRLHVRESLADVNGDLHFGSTKTYAVRYVALPRFLVDMLARHLAEDVANDPGALVFTGRDGEPLRNPTFHKTPWLPAIRRARLVEGLRIHDLRHTCAALLIAQGAHVKAIQRHLGHSSPVVTLNTYSHLFPEDMERVAQGLETTYQRSLAAPPRPRLHGDVVALDDGGSGNAR